MIYVGLVKGVIGATAHWYLAVTEDGITFKNEDKGTIKEVLEYAEEMQKETGKEVAFCFDHWGASSRIAEIAEFVSKHEHLHLELAKVGGERINKLMAEQIAINAIEKATTQEA